MIVRCEECGAKYQIDPSRITAERVKTRCSACGNTIIIHKPEEQTSQSTPGSQPEHEEITSDQLSSPTPSEYEYNSPETAEESPKPKKGMSLKTKIFILFFFIPVILFIGAGSLYILQLQNLSDMMTSEGSDAITELAEHIIAEKARAIAAEAKIYLEAHPEVEKENFYSNKEFREIILQEVGETGFGALHEMPEDPGEPIINWIYVDPKLVGTDIRNLKEKLPEFFEIVKQGKNGKESAGYYRWEYEEGWRDKYMVCAPVKGTSFYVAATTFLDEFTQPVDKMQAKAAQIRANIRNTVIIIMGIVLILLGFIASFYGNRLSNRIKNLTSVAEQISMGEMDAEIPVKSRDEIGDLAEAIQRMQDSIKLSIERLRRRR